MYLCKVSLFFNYVLNLLLKMFLFYLAVIAYIFLLLDLCHGVHCDGSKVCIPDMKKLPYTNCIEKPPPITGTRGFFVIQLFWCWENI